MSNILYASPLSQPSRAVTWFLTLNEIPFDMVKVDFQTMRGPEYLAMNPHHTMPMIKDSDGTIVFESNAVLFYLREKYGDKADLYPSVGGLIERTKVQQVLSWYPTSFRWPVVQYVVNVLVGPVRFGMPKPSEERTKELLDKVLHAAKLLNDTWLATPGYVVANKLSVADLQLVCEIEQLRLIPQFDWSPFPNIVRYRDLMHKVPHFNAVHEALIEMTSQKA